MTPWQNERWATAPTNDGRNFAPAHRWAVVKARPLCFGWLSSWYEAYESPELCPFVGFCAHLVRCEEAGHALKASDDARYAALARSCIREAHELREENDKLNSKLHYIERRPPSYPYDIDIERMSKKLEYYFEKTDMLSALVAASKQRIATLEAENAALRQNQPRCPDCGHRMDIEECGCGGDA